MEHRIFLASQEDIQTWGARPERVLNTIQQEDYIFLVNGNKPLNSAKEKLLQNMKTKAYVRIIDTEGQNSGIVGKKTVLDFLEKEPERKYLVYIIGASMNCVYEDRAEIEKYASVVLHHNNFSIQKVKPKQETEENLQILMDGIMGSVGAAPISTSMRSASDVPVSTVKKPKGMSDQKKKAIEKKRSQKKQGAVLKQRSTIERNIFGTAFESKVYEETYTDLENARAKYILELQKRTETHIRSQLFQKKETITLTHKELYDFIVLIMSSENAEMFNESWEAQHDIPIQMNDQLYDAIKPEVAFFDHICETVYDKDFWED